MTIAKEVGVKSKNKSSDQYNFSKEKIDPLMTSRYETLDLIRQGVYSINQLKKLAKDAKKI